jgi:hypothetical protein
MKNHFDDGAEKQSYIYPAQIKKKVRAYGTPEKSINTSSNVSRKKKGDQEMLEELAHGFNEDISNEINSF